MAKKKDVSKPEVTEIKTNWPLIIVLFIIGLIILVIAFWAGSKPPEAGARGSTIGPACQAEHSECSISNDEKTCCTGLVCIPFNEQSGNYKCEYPETSPTPTPTPTPTNMPTATPTPTDEPCRKDCEPIETLTPTPLITETQPPEKTESKPEGCTQNCGVPACTDTVPKEVANPHVYRNGDCAIVKWWPTEGNKANIYWKENSSGGWQHSLVGIDNTGYREICGLSNLDYTFGVQSVNGCASDGIINASNLSVIVDGNCHRWRLFR